MHGERIWYMETCSGSFVQFRCCPLCSFKGTLFSFRILLALAIVKRVHIYAGFGDKFLACFLTDVKMTGGYRLLFSDGQKFSCFVGCNPSKLLGSFP